MNNNITVTETAEKEVTANRVRVTVHVYGEGKKYAEAIDQAENKATSLVEAFSAVKNAELRGGGVNVSVRTVEKKKIYRASRTFFCAFDFDAKLFGDVTELLSATDVEWNVAFSFDDQKLRTELLAAAVEKAKRAAETIAKAAGVRLGALYGVEYASGGAARPMMLRAANFGGGDVAPEHITVSETVVASWNVESK